MCVSSGNYKIECISWTMKYLMLLMHGAIMKIVNYINFSYIFSACTLWLLAKRKEHVASSKTKKFSGYACAILFLLVYMECHNHGGNEPSPKCWCQYYQSTRRHTSYKLNIHQYHSSNLKSRHYTCRFKQLYLGNHSELEISWYEIFPYNDKLYHLPKKLIFPPESPCISVFSTVIMLHIVYNT
jgi:hypothetical protein